MKRIVFSTKFPGYHPRKGERTHFVEKIWKGLLPIFGEEEMLQYLEPYGKEYWDIENILVHTDDGQPVFKNRYPKLHTIRPKRKRPLKIGEEFLPVIWSGRPYHSPQIQFAPPLPIKTYGPVIVADSGDLPDFIIDGKIQNIEQVAQNDGLEIGDFADWFTNAAGKELELISWHNNPYYSK